MPIDPLVPEAITISPERIPQSQLVKIEKTSGTAFLNVAARAWEDAKILMIGEAPGAGLKEAALLKAAPGGGWWEGVFVPDASAKLAQISTTSGTTGQPKAIAISRRAISDTVDRLIGSMELDASVREYVGVPVTYSFGLGRVRAVSAAGGTVFLPNNGFRPDEIADMLGDGEINALSAVPTQLRTILANPDIIGAAGRRLRWLELGSQHMAAALWLQQFKDATDLRALCAKWGAALGALGALLAASLPGRWTQKAGEIVAIPAFAGAALLLHVGGIPSAEHWRTTTFVHIAIICGMLAFPIFIGHGMVIPIKAALESYGISGLISTVVPVGLFAAIMLWLGWRIQRILFGRFGTN